MSGRLPVTDARLAPEHLAILLRAPFLRMNDELIGRLHERGHPQVRYAHGNVFQFLDDAGTRVSVLAERAQMTKQSMAELVRHLEAHGYVDRVPDPKDRRAKLVRATARGREVFAIRGIDGGSAREVTVTADDREFRALVRLDTPREREYLRHGGILPFVLRRLAA